MFFSQYDLHYYVEENSIYQIGLLIIISVMCTCFIVGASGIRFYTGRGSGIDGSDQSAAPAEESHIPRGADPSLAAEATTTIRYCASIYTLECRAVLYVS